MMTPEQAREILAQHADLGAGAAVLSMPISRRDVRDQIQAAKAIQTEGTVAVTIVSAYVFALGKKQDEMEYASQSLMKIAGTPTYNFIDLISRESPFPFMVVPELPAILALRSSGKTDPLCLGVLGEFHNSDITTVSVLVPKSPTYLLAEAAAVSLMS